MATSRLGQVDSVLGTMRLGVLGGQSIKDTLVISESVVTSIVALSAADVLTIVDTATELVTHNPSVTDTLSIVDAANNGELQLVHETLSFIETVNRNPTPSTADMLSIVNTVVVSHVVVKSVTDTLSITEANTQSGGNIAVVTDGLGIFDAASAHVSTVNRVVTDTLFITETLARLQPTQDLGDIITITDTASSTVPDNVLDTLTIVDTALGNRVTTGNGPGYDPTTFHDTLRLVETVFLNQNITLHVADVLKIGDSVLPFVENPQQCSYAIQVGATAAPNIVLPPTVDPTPTGNATLTLTYPAVSPSTTLVLRNPEFENKFQYQKNRINRTTRGGQLIVFADPIWPKLQKLEFTVTYLQGIQMQELQAFLLESIGQTIGLLDWENQQWQGIILNPDAEISNPQRSNWSIALQFQGVLV